MTLRSQQKGFYFVGQPFLGFIDVVRDDLKEEGGSLNQKKGTGRYNHVPYACERPS